MKMPILIRKFSILFISISLLYSCSNDDENTTSDMPEPNFIGIWKGWFKDNIYDQNTGYPNGLDFTIDIKQQLTINDGNIPGDYIIGKIYFTNSTTSCCGGENDGQITAQYNGVGQLSNIVLIQDLEFSGSACPGTYAGTGTFTSNTLSINFLGTDCEGVHSGGEIQLLKED